MAEATAVAVVEADMEAAVVEAAMVGDAVVLRRPRVRKRQLQRLLPHWQRRRPSLRHDRSTNDDTSNKQDIAIHLITQKKHTQTHRP